MNKSRKNDTPLYILSCYAYVFHVSLKCLWVIFNLTEVSELEIGLQDVASVDVL